VMGEDSVCAAIIVRLQTPDAWLVRRSLSRTRTIPGRILVLRRTSLHHVTVQ
jgi:hypothetical protein